jgi:ADP-heptose:LPS heptosyltransferase
MKPRLLVVISGGLGDVLLATPFLKHFRSTDAWRDITCVVPAASSPLIHGNPAVDRVVACLGDEILLWAIPEPPDDVFSPYVEVRQVPHPSGKIAWTADLLFDLNQGSAPAIRQVAEHHGIPLEDERPEVFPAPEDEAWARDVVAEFGAEPLVLLGARSALPEKDYRRWQEVVDILRDEARIVELLDGESDLSGTTVIPLPPPKSSAALFARCHCVLTVDSFPAHLAWAVGTPAVVVFGPTNPAVWGHPGNIDLRDESCPVCADTPLLDTCPERRCLDAVEPKTVVDAVRRTLAEPATAGRS